MNQIRRRILESAGVLLATAALPALAAELLPTPAQMRGPFYPSRFPLDKDNDLVRVRGRAGVAFGHIVDISGRIVDARGRPCRSASAV